jgi:hypothetical protein
MPLGGRGRGDLLLHVRELLGADDRVVREYGCKRVEGPVGTRCGHDVEHDGAVRRELDVPLIRHARHEQ